MTFRRTLAAACLSIAAVLLPPPAHVVADDLFEDAAEGSVGWLRGRIAGETVVIDPVAPCRSGSLPSGNSGPVGVADVAAFDGGVSTCTVDGGSGHASVQVVGGRFRFDRLRAYGGQRIRLTSFTAGCETTATGSASWVSFRGLSGVRVPADVPANHVVTVRDPAGGPPLATITFNEVLVPSPPDGGMTVNLMHIRMFPDGGPADDDVVVGAVRCVPAH